MDAGTAKDCMTSRCLSATESLGLTEVELAYAVSAAFGAGIDTVTLTLIENRCGLTFTFPDCCDYGAIPEYVMLHSLSK